MFGNALPLLLKFLLMLRRIALGAAFFFRMCPMATPVPSFPWVVVRSEPVAMLARLD